MLPRTRAARLAGWSVAVAAGLMLSAAPAADDETARAIATLKAVGREGKANAAAGAAWKALVRQGAPALFPTLAAIDDADPTAGNWLRTAAEAIAEAEQAAGRKLPAAQVEAFVLDTKNAPTARRLAYELLVRQSPEARDRLLAKFLDDPSNDLRHDAVAAELAKIEKAGGPTAKADLERLFTQARDKDQVERIAKKLEADYKVKVSLPEHFGFVTHWSVIGPFDSAEGKALTTSHPPEKAADTSGTFKGKDGAELTWRPYATTDKDGMVDLNKALGKHKNAAGYALAVISAEKEGPCEVRVGTTNAIQVFLNGKKLFEREEYHHGAPFDHNVAKGTLRAGENVLVIKVCQNDQKEEHAQNWLFQARVCDATGGTIPGVAQRVADGGTVKTVKLGTIPEGKETKQ